MRAWIFVGLAGLALAMLGQIDALSPALGAAIAVASSIGLALLAHGGGTLATQAVVMGASGALTYEAMRPYLPLVATGLLLSFVFGTRAMRAKSFKELALHLGTAFAGGIAASWVASFQNGAQIALWVCAIVVAALLASLPWIVPSEAPRTFALRRLAARTRGPLRLRLLRAVAAHRRIAALPNPPSRTIARRINAAFDELTSLCEGRSTRGSGVTDERIRRAVDQLTRVARAASSRAELLDRLTSDALGTLHGHGDQLEAEVAALVEVE